MIRSSESYGHIAWRRKPWRNEPGGRSVTAAASAEAAASVAAAAAASASVAASVAAASEMDPVMRSSTDPVANAVLMLIERVDKLETKVELLEADLLEAKAAAAAAEARVAVVARFEEYSKRYENVPCLESDVDGFLQAVGQEVWLGDREEQHSWLHVMTCGMVDHESTPRDPDLDAFLSRNRESPRLCVYMCDAPDARHAMWLAAREDICDRVGVFHNGHNGKCIVVSAWVWA